MAAACWTTRLNTCVLFRGSVWKGGEQEKQFNHGSAALRADDRLFGPQTLLLLSEDPDRPVGYDLTSREIGKGEGYFGCSHFFQQYKLLSLVWARLCNHKALRRVGMVFYVA